MKEAILFSCGHTRQVELPVERKAREALRARMQESRCGPCTYQAKVQLAKEHADSQGLISLSGTPGQVAYGMLLRHQQLQFFARQLDLAEQADPHDPHRERRRRRLLCTVNHLPEATWWIEHQELNYLLEKLEGR